MNLGVAIKSVRNRLGVSQEALSDSSGISQTSISQIENGVKQPTKKTLDKLCKALKIPEAVLYIIGLENSDIPASRKKIFNELYPQLKELASQIVDNKSQKLIK